MQNIIATTRNVIAFRVVVLTGTLGLWTLGAIGAAPPAAQAASWYEMRPQYNTGYCVAVSNSNNGTQATLPLCGPYLNDGWQVIQSPYAGGGWSEIVNELSDKCLEDHNNGGSGTILDQWTCNGSESQAVWGQIIYGGYVWHLADGLCIDNGSHLVRAWTCNSTNSQQWDGP